MREKVPLSLSLSELLIGLTSGSLLIYSSHVVYYNNIMTRPVMINSRVYYTSDDIIIIPIARVYNTSQGEIGGCKQERLLQLVENPTSHH